jgi:cytoskeletal protein RodZ
MKQFNKFEKEAEQILPKKVNNKVKKYYLLYILGSVIMLALLGLFFYSYTKQVNKNQELAQQQIRLQKEQLDLQAKQIEDDKADIITTPATPTTTPTQSTTCNKTIQERQRKFMQTLKDKAYTQKAAAQSQIEVQKSKLTNPDLSTNERNSISENIGRLTVTISDADANISSRNSALGNINSCKLYDEKSMTDWGKALGVTY